MTKRYAFGLAAMALAGAIVGGCSSNSVGFTPGNGGSSGGNSPPPGAAMYQQIELLSRPAVKEVFEAFADHDATNRTEPYSDPTLQGMILSFSENFRSQQTSTALQSILYPNVMKADLSQNVTTASYLGYETGGATGSKFGGRGLDDDVVDISLGALFGNTLSALGVVPDDMKEVPCLTTDNVPYDKSNTKTFPYVQSPV
ncbi:MAG TPA: DUF4331 family protein [Candidatus Tumulicola sp.]|jgi:hypothetical protein